MEVTLQHGTRYLGNNNVIFEKLNDFVSSQLQEKLGANPYYADTQIVHVCGVRFKQLNG